LQTREQNTGGVSFYTRTVPINNSQVRATLRIQHHCRCFRWTDPE